MTSLAERAMLIRLKRSMWQPYAFDARATQAGGGRNLGRFNKKLCAGSTVLTDTYSKFNDLYRTVNNMTVPWLDDGVRMLNSAAYFDFTEQVRHHRALCIQAVNELRAKWPAIVDADRVRFEKAGHADLFDPTNYPHDIESYFNTDVQVFPIPTVADFRVDVSDEDKKAMEKAIIDAETQAASYVVTQMLDPVKRLVEKLSVPIGQEGAIFRNSLIENVLDMVNRVPALNIAQDQNVADTAKQIKEALLVHASHPDVLRESPIVRDKVRSNMEEIMNKMAAFMGGGECDQSGTSS